MSEQQLLSAEAQMNELVQTGDGMQPGPDVSGQLYNGYSQQELHDMVQTDADPAAVQSQADAFGRIAESMSFGAKQLMQAVRNAQSDWEGRAADSAQSFGVQTAQWHAAASGSAYSAQRQVQTHSESLSTARAAMPPPMAQPSPSDLVHHLMDNGVLGMPQQVQQFHQQVAAANTNQATQVRVAQQYDGALSTSSAMPQFTPLTSPVSTPPPATTPPPSSATGSSGGYAGAPSVRGSHGSSGANYNGGNGGSVPGGSHAAPPTAPGSTPGSGGFPGSTNTSGVGSAPGTHNTTGNPDGGSGGTDGGLPPGADPGGQDPALAGGVMGPVGPVGGGGFGGGDTYSPGRGYGGSSGLGGGSGSGGNAGSEAGGRSGANIGGAAAEEAAVESGAATGKAGTSGMAGGPMAGRGGKGEEDEEHETKFIQDEERDDLFGTDEPTVTPVIGLRDGESY
jgi:hypothetical protein